MRQKGNEKDEKRKSQVTRHHGPSSACKQGERQEFGKPEDKLKN
jgi:hypothetical protein